MSRPEFCLPKSCFDFSEVSVVKLSSAPMPCDGKKRTFLSMAFSNAVHTSNAACCVHIDHTQAELCYIWPSCDGIHYNSDLQGQASLETDSFLPSLCISIFPMGSFRCVGIKDRKRPDTEAALHVMSEAIEAQTRCSLATSRQCSVPNVYLE